MKTKFSLLCVLIIASIVLTACEIGMSTKVNADESGEMGAVIKFTEKELDFLDTMGGAEFDKDQICSLMDEESGLPTDVKYEQEKHGNDIWCVAAQPFETFEELIEEFEGGIEINTIEINDDRFVFDADIDLSEADFNDEEMTEYFGGEDGFSFIFYYELTAPGKIDKAKTTGDPEFSGNTARWDLLKLDEDNQNISSKIINIHLESSTSGGGGGFEFKWWYAAILLCCCLLVIFVVAVVVFFYMKKQKQQPVQTGQQF